MGCGIAGVIRRWKNRLRSLLVWPNLPVRIFRIPTRNDRVIPCDVHKSVCAGGSRRISIEPVRHDFFANGRIPGTSRSLPIECCFIGVEGTRKVSDVGGLGLSFIRITVRRRCRPELITRPEDPGFPRSGQGHRRSCASLRLPAARPRWHGSCPGPVRSIRPCPLYYLGSNRPSEIQASTAVARILHASRYARPCSLFRLIAVKLRLCRKEVCQDFRGRSCHHCVFAGIRRALRSGNCGCQRWIDLTRP